MFDFLLQPLPEFPRVKALNIPGNAYADLLMVEEFVYCFGHVLDIGKTYSERICLFLPQKPACGF